MCSTIGAILTPRFGTVAALGAFSWTRGLVPRELMIPCLILDLAAAIMLVVAWVRPRRPWALREMLGIPADLLIG